MDLRTIGSRLLTLASATLLPGCVELPARAAAPADEPYLAATSDNAGAPRLALVLSAGSLRGFAHVGVLRVLDAHGIRRNLVVGASVGSLVGALYASGMSGESMARLVESDAFTLGARSLHVGITQERPSVHDFIQQHARADRIERFPIGFAAVATEMQRGCLAVFNAGSAAVAAQASTGLPGVFAPTRLAGRDYADGGLTAPVPVRVARALGAERVVAVNVTFPPAESRLDGMVDRLFQMGLVMMHTMAAQEAREADVLIEPVLPQQDDIRLDNRGRADGSGRTCGAGRVAAHPRAARPAAARARRVSRSSPLRRGTGAGGGQRFVNDVDALSGVAGACTQAAGVAGCHRGRSGEDRRGHAARSPAAAR